MRTQRIPDVRPSWRSRLYQMIGTVLTGPLRLVTVIRPLAPFPNYTFGATDRRDWRFYIRMGVWGVTRVLLPGRIPIQVRWVDGLRMTVYLGNDVSYALFVAGCYEPDELYFVAEAARPGAVVIDVGANEGVFTLLAAKRVGPSGRVLAIEPSQREFERLTHGIERNGLGSIVSCAFSAVGDAPGRAVLHVADGGHAGQNTFGAFIYDKVTLAENETVPVECLDDLVAAHGLPTVDLVKIDVEGAELQVLRGAPRMLSELRPLMILEVQEPSLTALGDTTAELLEFLRSYDYDLFDFGPDGRLRALQGVPESLNMVARPQPTTVG